MELPNPVNPRIVGKPGLCPFLNYIAEQMAPSVRAATERQLWKLERRGITSRTALKKQLNDLPERDLCTALWVLGRVGTRKDAPKVLAIRRSRPKAATSAIEALAILGGKPARNELIRSVKDRTEPVRVRIAACHGLGHRWSGKVHPSIFYPIVSNQDELASLRGYAIESIGIRSSRGAKRETKEATAQILPCLDDRVAEVRFWAVFALATINASQALPKLRQLARKDHADGPFGWTVAEEAKDAVYCLTHEGRWPKVDAAERRSRESRRSTGKEP